jgi:hypothetical protein
LNELRPLVEPKFTHWANYQRQGPKNKKIRQEIDFILKNEPVPSVVAMSELSNGTKKHNSKSHETIPLKG